MIVLKDNMPESEMNSEYDISLMSLFHREIDAYNAYDKWVEETDDMTLAMGLEEIMIDEFLHAKFLREYLIDKDMYMPDEKDTYERMFCKIRKKFMHK